MGKQVLDDLAIMLFGLGYYQIHRLEALRIKTLCERFVQFQFQVYPPSVQCNPFPYFQVVIYPSVHCCPNTKRRATCIKS
jgi:hypothetical protein